MLVLATTVGLLSLIVLGAWQNRNTPDEQDSPDYWIDPEKERSAHLYSKHR